MFNLLKVEFFKLKKFRIGTLTLLLMIGVGFAYGYKMCDSIDNMASVFSYAVSDTSFVFLISLVMAILIGKDFSNRTIGNEIKLGYGRFHILLSRMIVAGISAVLLHGAYILSAEVGFAAMRGFDASVFCVENALWLIVVWMQLLAVISGVVMISFLTGKMSEAVALSTLYAFICCNILRNFLSSKIFTLSCFCFVQDNHTETLVFAAIIAFVTMTVFLLIAAFIFDKAEIK